MMYGADKGDNPYYTIVDGDRNWYLPSAYDPETYGNKENLTTVTIDASCKNYTGTTLESLFDYWRELTTINNLENLNTSAVTDMYRMFAACQALTSLDLSRLNTASVTNMHEMFIGLTLETIDLSGWNTSNVTDMYCMFYYSQNLKTIYVGDGWSTASVTNGKLMFSGCPNLPGFDSDKVTHEMAKLTTDGGYLTYKAPGIDLTINDTKTVATMESMPTFDVDVDYELVRDMAVSMPVTVGDGNDGYRIRLKKSEQNPGKFEPADTDVAGMIAMIKVHDAIENQDLIFFNLGGSVDCTVSIYAIDDNDQPVGNPVAFQDLVPGRYIAKATAATGSTYDGETANSNVFVLFQGYPVEVPAGEFATFYKDEPLYADPISSADAELYTISSINNDKAVLSSAIETAPSNTPLLVYNNSDEAKTFLLIPADAEPNLSLDVYDGFIGTLTATTIAASDEDQTNYAFNGKAFVYVKYAIPVAANKAWLNISNSNARVINIVFDETTGIANADRTKSTDDSWYTIDGRKVNAPTKKGVYILNGQKVVVK
jgi:surface protein